MKKILAGLIFLCASSLYGAGEITVINKIIPKNGAFTGVVDSSQTVVITDTLDNNLSGVSGDAQSMFEAIDNLTLGGGGASVTSVYGLMYSSEAAPTQTVYGSTSVVQSFNIDGSSYLTTVSTTNKTITITTNAVCNLFAVIHGSITASGSLMPARNSDLVFEFYINNVPTGIKSSEQMTYAGTSNLNYISETIGGLKSLNVNDIVDLRVHISSAPIAGESLDVGASSIYIAAIGGSGGTSSGASALQISEGGVEVTSPTVSLNFTGADFDISESPTNTSNVSLAEDISLSTISVSAGLNSIAISSHVSVTGDLTVTDEAYGAGWNGSLEVPTKNAVYDKVETISGGSPAGYDTEIQFNNSSVFGSSDTFTFTPASSILNLGETTALFNSNSKYRAAFDGNAYFQTIGFSNTNTLAGGVLVSRSRGTAASPLTVASGDRLGVLLAQGYDGSSMESSAALVFEVDGTVSSGIVPTRISFETEGAAGTRFERMRLTSEGMLLIGKETTASNDPLVVIGRTITGTGNAHAFVDESVVNKTGTIGYNSFDAKPLIQGSVAYDHIAGMQSRPNYASSGSISRLTGYQTIIDHDGGNAARVTSFEARDYTGTGTADLQIGLYVENLTQATSNYAISIGTSDTNQNLLHVGVTGDPVLAWDESADNFTLNKNLEVSSETYGASWNGSNEVPTKNDVYDKIESLPGGGGASVAGYDTEIQFNDGGVFGSSDTFTFTSASNILNLGETSGLFNANSKYNVAANGNAYFQTIGFSNTDTTAGGLLISRSRGTAASPTTTQSGDRLGAVLAQGYDGSTMQTSAGFLFEVDGTVSTGVMPTRISFETEGASGTRFERMRLTSEGILIIGKETTTSSDPLVVVGRTLTGSGNAHAYVDETNVNKSGTIGYNSFDAKPEVTGSQNYDHIAGMQSRPDYASSGTVDRLVGFQTIINSDGGNANRITSFEARDLTGTGTADLQVGLYVQNLTKATSNYAISIGTSDTNQNLLHVGVTGDPLLAWDEGNDVFTLSKDITVPTEVYGGGWNGSNEVPTKDAVYDRIETISGGASTLAIATGTSSGFSSVTSSPTAVINFSSTTFTSELTGSATAYISVKMNSSDGEVLYNKAGAFSGDANQFTYDDTLNRLTVGGIDHIGSEDIYSNFENSSGGDTRFWYGLSADEGGNDNDYFQIGDGATDGTSPLLTLDTDGNLGLGDVTPSTKLVVTGTATITESLQFVSETAASAVCISDDGADRLFHDTDCDGVKDGGEEYIDQAGGAGGSDNLGNHIATTTLDMSNFDVIDVSTISVSTITSVTGNSSIYIGTTTRITNGDFYLMETDSKLYIGDDYQFTDFGGSLNAIFNDNNQIGQFRVESDNGTDPILYIDFSGDGIIYNYTPVEIKKNKQIRFYESSLGGGNNYVAIRSSDPVDHNYEFVLPSSTLTAVVGGNLEIASISGTTVELEFGTDGGGSSPEKLYSLSAPGTLATIPDGVAEYDGVAPINEDAGTNANVLTAIFDDTADECRGFQIISPSDLDTSGTAEFHVNWYSGSSTSGNVQWYVAISTMSEGTSWDKVPTQYGATSDAVQGTVDQVTKTSWTASVATLGITVEQLVTGWFCRDGDGDIGTDSMTGDAAVISFGIGLPRQ